MVGPGQLLTGLKDSANVILYVFLYALSNPVRNRVRIFNSVTIRIRKRHR